MKVDNLIEGEKIMSKGQDSKKGSKKVAAKTMQEKKNAKRDKKSGKTDQGIISVDKKK
jgi:hypothetical protein